MTDNDLLAVIVAAARERVAEDRRRRPLSRPEDGCFSAPADTRSTGSGGSTPPARRGRLTAALSTASSGALALIAEVKRSSPSKGAIAPGLDAAAQAQAYAAAGADAVSVLTEPSRFGGSLRDLADVTAAVAAPVLRKDFVVDAYQVWEAAELRAAAVLLIVAALSDTDLRLLVDECRHCDLDALVEVHDEADLERALTAGATLIGVNNRDLRTLTVDLAVTERLAPFVPSDVLLVSESGIAGADDAHRAAAAGARALLVGEALVRAPHDRLGALVRELKGAVQPGRHTHGAQERNPEEAR